MSLSNEEVIRLLDDYLHGLLDPEEAAEVERRCETSPAYKAALEEAQRRMTALRAESPTEASEQLIQATFDHIQKTVAQQRRWRRRLLTSVVGTLAASVLILTGLQIYTAFMSASPVDITVLGQRELLAATMSSLRIRLMERPKNQPLANVPVTVELKDPRDGRSQQLASLTTDALGVAVDTAGKEPRFQLPDWEDGKYELRVTAQARSGTEVMIQPVDLKRSWQLMLSSDKPVYKPGQTIHVRALALRRPDLKPVGKQDATLSVADPKGNLIFKQQVKTSDHGITSADCSLADEILEGDYKITCRIGDTESSLQVQVLKYVLPKFKVAVKLDRPYYQPGETARCTVQADYFFGKPVTGADVEVKVFNAETRGLLKAFPKALSDANGTVVVEFPVPQHLARQQPVPQPPIQPGFPPGRFPPPPGQPGIGDARPGAPGAMPVPAEAPTPPPTDVHISFQAQITDTAGQKQAGSAERIVTNEPVRIEVFPECGSLVEGVANKVYVLVNRVDGSPVQARLRVSGIGGDLRTDAQGTASFEYLPKTRETRWTVRATDDEGEHLAHKTQVLYCGDATNDFLVRTDKAVYRGGDSVKFIALGSGNEPIFVDFIKDGKDLAGGKERISLLSATIPMSGGQGEYTLDLPPDLFGTLELCSYRLDASGVALRKSRAIYIHQPGGLQIKATLDHPEYRPGGHAKLNLSLTDSKGQPATGAISLAAVDEAVFAVLKAPPGSERTFFTVEQQLLKSATTVRPWRPEPVGDKPSPQRERLEQALFAATARSMTMPWPAVLGQGPTMKMAVRKPRTAEETGAFPDKPHSLTVATHEGKVKATEELRKERLTWLLRGWLALFGISLLAGYGCLWCFIRPSTMLKVHGGMALVLVPALFLGFCLIVLGSRSAGSKFTAVASRVAEDKAMPMEGAKGMAPMPAPGGMGQPPMREGNADGPGKPMAQNEPAAPAPRLRQLFPETLLWEPNLVTDDKGRVLDISLADSITTWRLSASAVAGDGRLGAAQLPLKVFQPFFVELDLPVSLTRNDEVSVPAVVYSYLDKPQTVSLQLKDADWFTRQGDGELKLELQPGQVRSASFRIKVTRVGSHKLQATALGQGVSDALERDIDVVPDGKREELVFNGNLQQEADIDLVVPKEAIEGSAHAYVKIYPSSLSQLVEGLDNIFQMPSGCFEQTSSTTYPNVLALDYLKRTGQSQPKLEAKARQYIHLGYQRLLGFEVRGGGFDWYGHGPANQRLTAYGLMEFSDMAKVHNVDPEMLKRTRNWLLSQRQPDGSWLPDMGRFPQPMGQRGDMAQLSATAYVAWAVYGSGTASDARLTLDYILTYRPNEIKDPYILALVCNALLAIDSSGKEAGPYIDRLEFLKSTTEDGKFTWWQQQPDARTGFYGAGMPAQVETTALAVLAMLQAKTYPGSARGGLAWLVSKKDPNGTWYSTQATVLSLKALVAGTEAPKGDGERRIVLHLGKNHTEEIRIPADQADVLRLVPLSDKLKEGKQHLTLTEESKTAAAYQVSFRYHVPEAPKPATTEPLAIQLNYDRTEVPLTSNPLQNEVKATVVVRNQMKQNGAMVMVELPIPAGFTPVLDDFKPLLANRTIERYQTTGRQVLVYLRELPVDRPLFLTYRLQARMPVKILAPGARVYEYYTPQRQGRSPATPLTVTARP